MADETLRLVTFENGIFRFQRMKIRPEIIGVGKILAYRDDSEKGRCGHNFPRDTITRFLAYQEAAQNLGIREPKRQDFSKLMEFCNYSDHLRNCIRLPLDDEYFITKEIMGDISRQKPPKSDSYALTEDNWYHPSNHCRPILFLRLPAKTARGRSIRSLDPFKS